MRGNEDGTDNHREEHHHDAKDDERRQLEWIVVGVLCDGGIVAVLFDFRIPVDIKVVVCKGRAPPKRVQRYGGQG